MKELLCEANGKLSSVRLNSAIAVIVSVALSIYAIAAGKIPDPTTLILGWLSMGFIPKVAQKALEAKNDSVPK
jgi:hypothetical protein